MATRRKPQQPDLSDLKARLGLNKSLETRPQILEEAPPEEPEAPQGFDPGQPQQPWGAAPQGQPFGQAPGQARPPFAGPPGGPARPPFAGPPGGPPKPKAKPRPETDWNPPASDPSAAADVPLKSHRSTAQLLGMVGVAAIIGMIAMGVGFFFGNASQQRALYDAQSADARRVNELITPKIEKLNAMTAAAGQHDGMAPDEEVLKKIANLDFVLEPEEVARDKLLLGPEITTLLMRFTSDTKLLAEMIKTHRTMTTRVDKKELEELAKADEAAKAAGFAVVFDTDNFTANLEAKKQEPPLEGKLMIIDTIDAIDKDGEKFVKLRSPASGQEREWSLRKLVLLDKKEMLASSGPNAMRRYERRHKEIAAKLKEVSQYTEALSTQLSALADRPAAPLLSVGQ